MILSDPCKSSLSSHVTFSGLDIIDHIMIDARVNVQCCPGPFKSGSKDTTTPILSSVVAPDQNRNASMAEPSGSVRFPAYEAFSTILRPVKASSLSEFFDQA